MNKSRTKRKRIRPKDESNESQTRQRWIRLKDDRSSPTLAKADPIGSQSEETDPDKSYYFEVELEPCTSMLLV